MDNVLGVKYCVVRDYTAHAPGLGSVTCAEFYEEEDAREYYRWQKRRWKAEEKKYGDLHFVWKLYKRTDYYSGTHPTGCDWELLDE